MSKESLALAPGRFDHEISLVSLARCDIGEYFLVEKYHGVALKVCADAREKQVDEFQKECRDEFLE
jgi:hypothetical protein